MPLDPISPYSFSKASATAFCRMAVASLGSSVRVLRLFLVYGPGQGEERFLPQLIRAALTGAPLRMTGGEQTREYTYIDDVIEGLLVGACSGPGRGEVYNLGSGEEITLNSLVGTVESIAGCRINRDPEVLPYRAREIRRFVGDHSRIKKDLGWISKVDLAEGLHRTIDWHRNLQPGK
jgi:nucleoside-diphosphate-sugar epimerase